jgi:hypothetical protein
MRSKKTDWLSKMERQAGGMQSEAAEQNLIEA